MRPPFIDILRYIKTLPVLCCGPSTKPLATADAERLAARFKALADPTRVAIVNRLAAGECCVCDLNDAFDLSQPTISHHLKLLHEAGILDREKRGVWVYYRLNARALSHLATMLGGVTV